MTEAKHTPKLRETAIEAEINALRKLFRNHEKRLEALDTSTHERTSLFDLVHIGGQENLEIARKVDKLQYKVENHILEYGDKIAAARKQIEGNIRCFARRQGSELNQDLRTLEHKVEDMEKRLKAQSVVDLIREELRAQAPDGELLTAAKRCLNIFRELAYQGNYPKMLVDEGWQWLINAIEHIDPGSTA